MNKRMLYGFSSLALFATLLYIIIMMGPGIFYSGAFLPTSFIWILIVSLITECIKFYKNIESKLSFTGSWIIIASVSIGVFLLGIGGREFTQRSLNYAMFTYFIIGAGMLISLTIELIRVIKNKLS